MRRREFVTLVGGAAAMASRPLPTFAQTPSKRPLIAAQIGGSKTEADRFFGGFSQGIRELGYVEGRDYEFEVRYADGNVSRIPPLIEELVRLKPDIIVSGTLAGVIAAPTKVYLSGTSANTRRPMIPAKTSRAVIDRRHRHQRRRCEGLGRQDRGKGILDRFGHRADLVRRLGDG